MLKRAFLSGLMLLGTVLPLAAQEMISVRSEESLNRLGVAIGVCGIASDRINPSLLLSALYSRTILQGLDLEFSVQHTAGSRFSRYDPVSPNIDIVPPLVLRTDYDMSFWNLTTADATVLFSPWTSGFRFGIGATLQNRQYGSANTLQIPSNQPPSIYYYQERLVLGGNLKIDYVIPLSKTLDIGLRTQAHLLLFRLTGDDAVKVFADGTASASLFLRVGF